LAEPPDGALTEPPTLVLAPPVPPDGEVALELQAASKPQLHTKAPIVQSDRGRRWLENVML